MVAGFWTGRKIVALHLIVLIIILAGEIYLLKISLSTSEQFLDIYNSLAADPGNPPAYADFEKLLAEKFNRFFFGAASECKSKCAVRFVRILLSLTYISCSCIVLLVLELD